MIIMNIIMTDQQYTQYQNLHIFATKWRKFKQKGEIKNKSSFRKEMQFKDFVELKYTSSTGKPIIIYLLAVNSKFNTGSQDLKRLLSKIREPTDIIIVTNEAFKIYSTRALEKFTHLNIKVYLHENFNLIIPNGPLCYPHRIMDADEVNHLLNEDLCCQLINLPKILIEDVQCIWIGAEIGDVIEIKMISDTTGETIQYRVVVPKSGKIISFN